MMERGGNGSFTCSTHDTYFLPALQRKSPLWGRVEEGLRMFDIAEENLAAGTCFRLDMVARPRFTAQLFAPTATTPGTFGFLLGDAANAIHFWPGRGLNSGLASALSLARSLAGWRGRPLRDADFVRHEAVMGMLRYRHESRAGRQMVTRDEVDVDGLPAPTAAPALAAAA
jgi:2-polyprenyl-6-methoxyphenol hydroxylase-like FAD-dependent oxidoreductase